MPPQFIIMGMPEDIMVDMRLQHSMNISLDMPSIGVISQVMPVGVIVHFILHIIMGIMFIIGIICMPIPFMPIMFIIGIICIIGIFMAVAFIILISVRGMCFKFWLYLDALRAIDQGFLGAVLRFPPLKRKAVF